MTRPVVFAVIGVLLHGSVAFAGETLLQSARRATEAFVEREVAAPSEGVVRNKPDTGRRQAARSASVLQEQPGGLEAAGLRRRTKLMIAAAAIVGFVGIAYKIDRSVEDNTPSSLGRRQD